MLELNERAGFIRDVFPPHSHQKFADHLTSDARCVYARCVYAGFDPTADSLHVGNFMVINLFVAILVGNFDASMRASQLATLIARVEAEYKPAQ